MSKNGKENEISSIMSSELYVSAFTEGAQKKQAHKKIREENSEETSL